VEGVTANRDPYSDRPPWTQSEGGGEAGGDAHPTIKLDLMRRGPLFIDSL